MSATAFIWSSPPTRRVILLTLYTLVLTAPGSAFFKPLSPCQSSPSAKEPSTQGIFRGLTLDEFARIRDFVFNVTSLGAKTSSQATLSSNYIFLIEDYLPSKAEILSHQAALPHWLGAEPVRKARVVMFMGAERPKSVREYLVYPVSAPSTVVPIAMGKTLTWKSRPLCPQVEWPLAAQFIDSQLPRVKRVLQESFGMWIGSGCRDRCLYYAFLPRAVPTSDERHLEVLFYHSPEAVEGFYLYPVAFHVVIYTPNNGDAFAIKSIYYNNYQFDSLESLLTAYHSDAVKKIDLRQYEKYARVYGSPMRRGPPTVPAGMRPPEQRAPDGNRFAIRDHHVNYLGWSFDIYFRTVSGLQLFNVKYMGEDIAFEVGMQNIAVLYGSREPQNLFRNYYDEGFALGTLTFPVIRGVDCPSHAEYLDSVIYSPGSDEARVLRDAACVFEHVNSVPLRRHYDETSQFSMPDSVLIVRQIITVGNYDYVYDYEFHQTGLIEAKVSSTGYVAATNDKEQRYGFLLNRDQRVNANVHVHAFSFKFDVDVATTANRLVSIDMEAEETTHPLSPSGSWQQLRMQHYLIGTEKEAVSHYRLPKSKYYLLQSSLAENGLGYRKSYRVFSNNFTPLPIAGRNPFVDAASWVKNALAVTVRKESERTIASLYTQGDPFNPVVNIESFYADDESIVDQDLVVWATVMMHHFPSAEDIPVTTTPGKTLVVTLAPFNFFDEDPSISSDDAVVINRNQTRASGSQQCTGSKRQGRSGISF